MSRAVAVSKLKDPWRREQLVPRPPEKWTGKDSLPVSLQGFGFQIFAQRLVLRMIAKTPNVQASDVIFGQVRTS
jgi:hypothetical protein